VAAAVQVQAAAPLHLQVAQPMAAAQETLAEQVFLLVVEIPTTQQVAVVDQAAQVATLHQVFKEQVVRERLIQ
jgi:hypothetical protein